MLYIEVEIFLNGNQKPAYSHLIETHFELLQPVGFFGNVLFLLQLPELYLGRSVEKVFTNPVVTDYSCSTLDLQKCKEWKLLQYGCLKPQAATFTLHLHHYGNRHFFSRRFLFTPRNGLGNINALHLTDFDADQ